MLCGMCCGMYIELYCDFLESCMFNNATNKTPTRDGVENSL